MQVQISDRGGLSRWIVIAVDILILNAVFALGSQLGMKPTTHMAQMLWNMAYFISVIINAPVAQNHLVHQYNDMGIRYYSIEDDLGREIDDRNKGLSVLRSITE